jgi:hypothetical protein
MNTLDIESILSGDPTLGPSFAGVYPRDVFIATVGNGKRGVFVLNADTSSQPGSHWLSVVTTPTETLFFDSYGFPPDVYGGIRESLILIGKLIEWNRIPLQGPLSTVCGDYCVTFCLLLSRGWGMKDFTSRMEKIPDAEDRDHAVRAMLISAYGSKLVSGYYGVHIPGSGLS